MAMLPILLLMAATRPDSPALTSAEIVDRMVRADGERLSALAGYVGARHYRFENKRFNKQAEMTVRVTCTSTGAKTFEIVQESGSGFVRNKVIRKMIDAEQDASQKGEHEQTRIIPKNYDFQLVKTEVSDGRTNYVLEIRPKTNNQYLVRGRIWVDAEDFAIARVEGTPAKNPSFWIHHVHVVQRYERVGRFWLPATNRSDAEVRVFGPTVLEIDYRDYAVNDRQLQVQQRVPQGEQQ